MSKMSKLQNPTVGELIVRQQIVAKLAKLHLASETKMLLFELSSTYVSMLGHNWQILDCLWKFLLSPCKMYSDEFVFTPSILF